MDITAPLTDDDVRDLLTIPDCDADREALRKWVGRDPAIYSDDLWDQVPDGWELLERVGFEGFVERYGSARRVVPELLPGFAVAARNILQWHGSWPLLDAMETYPYVFDPLAGRDHLGELLRELLLEGSRNDLAPDFHGLVERISDAMNMVAAAA